MRVEIMWGEPQHAFIEVPDGSDNGTVDDLAYDWVMSNHPNFDSWDWKRSDG